MTSVAIIAYNRPDYFEKSINSILKSTTEISHLYAFFDGPKSSVVDKQIVMIQDLIGDESKYTIITSESNLGCGVRSITARQYIFEHLKLENCFFFEDDLVISPSYIQVCLNIQSWLTKNYNQNFVVQGWNENILPSSNGLEHLVQNTQCHWWGFLMTKKVWDAIAPTMQMYKMRIVGQPYNRIQGAHNIYREIIRKNLDEGAPLCRESRFPVNEQELNRILINKGYGQDMTMASACIKNGILKVAPYVSRGESIGERGIHFTPNYHRKLNLHLIKAFTDSSPPTTFEVV